MFYMMTDHLSEAYKSIYQRKDLTSPPKDAEGMTGKMNPQGEPKAAQGGDHANAPESMVRGRYRAAYEEYKDDLRDHHLEKFTKWMETISEGGYDITRWEKEELIETYIKENNLWESREIVCEAVESFELDENRRAARAAGASKDDTKKQPDPSKDGFTGIGNMSIDAIRKMSARIEKEKTKKEEVEQYVDFLMAEGYDCSELTWDDISEEYASLDEGLRSAIKKFLGKKDAEKKPESRGEQLRKKYNVGPEKSDTSAKMLILKKTRAKKEADQKQYGDSKYSKSVAKKSAEAHDRYLKGGYSKYGAGDARGKGNKARKRAERLTKEELEATGKFTAEEIERILDIEEGKGAIAAKAMAKQGAAQGAGVGSAQDYIDIVNKRMETLKSIIPKTAGQIQREHHQKDDEGNVIEHEETTPSSVEEGLGAAVKVAGKMIAKQAAQSAAQGAADRAGEAAYNKMRNVGKKPQVEEVEVEETTVEEGMKQARANVGASTCWDGYKAKGTKKKGGKEVPNCVKEEETGGVLVQDAADYTPTEIETVDVVKPEPLKFQIEDHAVKFSEKNEEVVVDPTELVKKHAPNIAAARPLDEIAPALAIGAKVLAKKVAIGAAKSAAKGAAMGAAQNKLGGGNDV